MTIQRYDSKKDCWYDFYIVNKRTQKKLDVVFEKAKHTVGHGRSSDMWDQSERMFMAGAEAALEIVRKEVSNAS